jgi:hypothetical protein
MLYSGKEIGRNSPSGSCHFLLRDPQTIAFQIYPIEGEGPVVECRVASVFHVGHDFHGHAQGSAILAFAHIH